MLSSTKIKGQIFVLALVFVFFFSIVFISIDYQILFNINHF